MEFFEKLPPLEHPYLRAIAARYMPEEYKEIIKNVFLKDPDQNVRLVAANRLRWSEDKEAIQELIKA
ncbi:MAG TPA: hypothetical protein PLF20_09535, partial [Bacteroidales bacterium]|nr:hypothetical protein [Bacteroidales bacterium]